MLVMSELPLNVERLISLKSENKKILASGTVHTFTPNHLEIDLLGMKIVMSFINDGDKQQIKRVGVSPKELRIEIYNFNNALGTGTTTPLEIGVHSERKLFLAFTVYAFNDKSLKLVHYTFFIEE